MQVSCPELDGAVRASTRRLPAARLRRYHGCSAGSEVAERGPSMHAAGWLCRGSPSAGDLALAMVEC
ncbi:hypothetical protein [Rhodococcus sp. MALMAid1271]|uniref:hypothetical protein n=1 Tax=Rhodococcus sp. MALMAid1271 TaxID=3411744 RepID=UPI003BA0F65E